MRKRNGDPLSAMRKKVESEIYKAYPTVEQFCWDKGLSKATVSNFLLGKKDFQVSTLVKIADALGMKLTIQLVL